MAQFNSTFYFPAEGLNFLINTVPRNVQTAPSSLYLGLTSTSWGTISGYVAAGSGIQLNTPLTGTNNAAVIEASGLSGYSRQGVTSAAWTVPSGSTVTIGSETGLPVQFTTTYSGFTWLNTGATYSTINGIFLTISGQTGLASSAGSTVLWYAPFSDLSTVTLASGDSLTVTPTWQQASYPY